MLNPLLVIVITVNVLPRCFLSFNNRLAELFVFCLVVNSKIRIELTAKNAASTPEQQAEPIKIIRISRISINTLDSIESGH